MPIASAIHTCWSLSRLHPVKNLEALIEAFVEIVHAGAARMAPDDRRERRAGVRRDSSQRLVRPSRAADRVTFVGWVDGEAKRQFFERASLFALPSLHENFGVSLVEAMAAGVPGVVSRHVHLAEAVGRAAPAGWSTRTVGRSRPACAMPMTVPRSARHVGRRPGLSRAHSHGRASPLIDELYDRLAAPVSASRRHARGCQV